MDWKKFKIEARPELKLAGIDTRLSNGNPAKTEAMLAEDLKKISKLQYRLYAESRQSLLIIFQGMDASGKDGTIKRVSRGMNPQGILVYSFKAPTALELEQNFLWRHAQKLPGPGQIAIFNRSHYENVLISKVHPELVLEEHLPGIDSIDKIKENFWTTRYSQINDFEKGIVQNGTQIVKFFLHLSKDEQRKRFLERIKKKEKHWKFAPEDIAERRFWDDYQSAYERALKSTHTEFAPWFIVPADDKTVARFITSKIVLEKLDQMEPMLPRKNKKEQVMMKLAKKELKHER